MLWPKDNKEKRQIMVMRTFSLALVFFLNWQMAQLSTASQDWISLRGCYNYMNETGSIVPFNEPQACFDTCPNSTAVGLKNSTCICYESHKYTGLRRDILCGLKCPGKPWLYCGGESGSNGFINVYSKDPLETNDINNSTDYGFVSVSISASGKTYHAFKNDSTVKNGFICYDDIYASDSCRPFDKRPDYTWENASEHCHKTGQVLIAFSTLHRCDLHNLLGGVFWIGLYRNSPVSVTSSTTTSISTVSSALTPTTTTKHTTVSSFSHEWTTSVNGTGTSSEGSKDDVINAVYVAVPVVAAVLAVVVIIVFICQKRKLLCFKSRPNRISEESENNPNGIKTSNGKKITENVNVPPDNVGNNITARDSLLRTDDINNYKDDERKEAAIYNNVTDLGKIDADNKRYRMGDDFKGRGKKKKKKKKQIKKENAGQSNIQIENCTDHLRNADITKTDHVETNVIYKLFSQVEHDQRQEPSTSKHKETSEDINVKNGDLWNKVENNNLPKPNAGNNILAHHEAEIAHNINDTGKMYVYSKRDRKGEDSQKSGKKKKKKDKKHNKKEAAGQSMVQTENSTDHLSNADIKETDHADANGFNQLYSQAENKNRQEGSKRKHKKTLEGKDIENSAHLNKVDYRNVSQPNAGNNIPAQESVMGIDVIHNLEHNEFKETQLANNVGYTGRKDLDGYRNGMREYSERHGKKKKKKDNKYSEIETTGQSIVQIENITDHLRNAEIKTTDHVDTIGIHNFCSQAEHEERQEGSTRKHKKKIR